MNQMLQPGNALGVSHMQKGRSCSCAASMVFCSSLSWRVIDLSNLLEENDADPDVGDFLLLDNTADKCFVDSERVMSFLALSALARTSFLVGSLRECVGDDCLSPEGDGVRTSSGCTREDVEDISILAFVAYEPASTTDSVASPLLACRQKLNGNGSISPSEVNRRHSYRNSMRSLGV